MKFDIFICHASEDKDNFVRPLINTLKKQNPDLKIWYDEFSLSLGDSLRRKIDYGLANSKFGVVLISRNFFNKEWPQKELDALTAREIKGQKIILPIWCDISYENIMKYSPLLADRYASKIEEGMEVVAQKIIEEISPKSSFPPKKIPTKKINFKNVLYALLFIALILIAIIFIYRDRDQTIGTLFDKDIGFMNSNFTTYEKIINKTGHKEVVLPLLRKFEKRGLIKKYGIKQIERLLIKIANIAIYRAKPAYVSLEVLADNDQIKNIGISNLINIAEISKTRTNLAYDALAGLALDGLVEKFGSSNLMQIIEAAEYSSIYNICKALRILAENGLIGKISKANLIYIADVSDGNNESSFNALKALAGEGLIDKIGGDNLARIAEIARSDTGRTYGLLVRLIQNGLIDKIGVSNLIEITRATYYWIDVVPTYTILDDLNKYGVIDKIDISNVIRIAKATTGNNLYPHSTSKTLKNLKNLIDRIDVYSLLKIADAAKQNTSEAYYILDKIVNEGLVDKIGIPKLVKIAEKAEKNTPQEYRNLLHKYSKPISEKSTGIDSKIMQILQFKSKDGKGNLIEALYGFQFDLNSPLHLKILKNIANQIKSEENQYGVALDIDKLEFVYDKATLVCRDLADLELMLQNQFELYEHGRELIIQLFGLKPNATFEMDPLLRQIIVDYESKIQTAFRTKGVHLNLKTLRQEEIDLKHQNVQEVIDHIGKTLELRIRLGTSPGSSDYDVSHIDRSFFPTGGYNIL